jgi:hypothetical protein
MIHQQQRHGIVPALQPAQQVERGAAGVGTQNAIAVLVMPLQVALDGPKNFRVVVYGQNDRLLHRTIGCPECNRRSKQRYAVSSTS